MGGDSLPGKRPDRRGLAISTRKIETEANRALPRDRSGYGWNEERSIAACRVSRCEGIFCKCLKKKKSIIETEGNLSCVPG